MRKIIIGFLLLLIFLFVGGHNLSLAACIPTGGSGCSTSGATNCCNTSDSCKSLGLGGAVCVNSAPAPACIPNGASCDLGGTSCCDASASCATSGLGRKCTPPPPSPPSCIPNGASCDLGGTSCCDASATCAGAGLGRKCTPPVVNPSCIATGSDCTLGGTSCCDASATCATNGLGRKCLTPNASAQPPNAPLQSPCVNDDPQKGCDKIMTAFGPIDTTPNKLVTLVLGIVLSISGIILLLLLITNGYKLMTSQGDPEKIKDARDGIIAAISGLLLIVFSLVILEFITVGILGIPGFGK